MAKTTYILEQIKLDGALRDLISRSNGDNVTVTYNGSEQTLTAALASVLAGINALPTDSGVDGKISAAINGLIGGAPATYDTLKEIADYIAAHEDVVTALNSAIGAKASKTEFDALKETVDALGTLAAKSKVSEADLDTALAAKLNTVAEGNHGHTNKSVLDGITAEKVSEWDAKAGTETATASASGLMSSADKARLDGLRGVRYGASAPDDMQEGELFVKVTSVAEPGEE